MRKKHLDHFLGPGYERVSVKMAKVVQEFKLATLDSFSFSKLLLNYFRVFTTMKNDLIISSSLSPTHSLTHIHSRTPTLSQTLSPSHCITHSLHSSSHILNLSHSHTPPHLSTHTHTISLAHLHTHSLHFI